MKISVIIPAYNCEKYIDECLNSVLNQTFEDFEIIIVCNKSSDGTLEKIKEYEQTYDKIRLIELDKNYKQGIARNIGIENAKGEYILFVDSDDKVSPDFAEKMYVHIKERNTDIAICNSLCFDSKTGRLSDRDPHFQKFYETYKDDIFCWRDIKEDIYYLSRVVWNKIYRRSFLTEKKVKFPGEIFFEDLVFGYDVLIKASNISVFDDILVYYRTNNNNSVTSKTDKTLFDYFTVFELIRQIFKNQNLYDEMKYYYLEFTIHTMYLYWTKIGWKYKKSFYEKMKEAYTDFASNDIPNNEDKEKLYHTTLFLLKRVLGKNYYQSVLLYLKDRLLKIEY